MVKRAIVAVTLLAVSTGCMGTGGLGGKVKKFNLEVTENRWGREGTFLALNLLWVYRICTVLDLFVFNSIEFWSGKNPINGKKPLVDVPKAAAEKLGMHEIHTAEIERLSDTEAKLYLEFRNGDRMTVDVLRDGDRYAASYLGRVLFEGQLEDVQP